MKPQWEFALEFDRRATVPPFLQIARKLSEDIRRGRLRASDRLPGSRRLASTLGVHRNTVLAAYSELVAEGWIETAQGRGTFVASAIPEAQGRRLAEPLGPRRSLGTRTTLQLPDAPLAYRPLSLPPGTLNLSSGAPDIHLVPSRVIGRAYRRVLAVRAVEVLGYGDPEGHPSLRRALASMLATTRGLSPSARDVLVTRGSQMALSLVARALLRRGDRVAVEQWGYRPAWEAFRAAGANVVPIPVDRDGIDVDALRKAHRRSALRAVYLTPHHQYPTTVTLKAARRLEVLSMARDGAFAIVEDDYDHEFHYDGRPVLPMASVDRDGVVVYVGTLSKVLAPGLRVGYIVASPPVLQRVAAIRSLLDIQGDLATEAAIAAMIEDGEVQRHIARVRRIYADRRAALAIALRRALGTLVEFEVPAGGMAMWLKFPKGTDVEAWAQRSLECGVSWYTGRRYSFDQQPHPYARLSFASLNEREIGEAVRRMAAARR
jgi:GntR family transcriptional regulator / MocR family aminotransferase